MLYKLYERSPYLATICLYVGLFTFIGFPAMWIYIGLLTHDWSAPAYFILGFPAIGLFIGNLSYLFSEK